MKKKVQKNNPVITVTMFMRSDTIKKVNGLKKILQTNSRADAVRSAIALAHLVATKMQKGDKVIFEPSSFFQARQRLILPPFNS